MPRNYRFSVEPVRSKTALAQLIGRYEGFGRPGTVATRNNNPGNLKYVSWSETKTGLDSRGFAIYSSEEDGWADLHTFLESKSHLTISELMYLYAPPGENSTESYISFIAKQLGVSRSTRLMDL